MNFIQPDWPAPNNIKAYTTLRNAWGAGQNIPHERDDASLKALLNLPSDPLWLKQTHSTIAIEATPENKGKNADASFTQAINRVCVVSTADCLPILICNNQGTHVAAIHAGWRGLANGIIEATLNALNQPSNDLLIWLGPAIGPKKFAVGKDVYNAFTEKHPESANAFKPHSENKWLADLYALARIRLNLYGIKHIYGGNFCTVTEKERFFSYRGDKGHLGIMASLIFIADPSGNN